MAFNESPFAREFRELAAPHMTLMYRVAVRYCGNPSDAEDIVQETCLTAFRHFRQLREKTKIKSWLLQILKNIFLKSYHKEKIRHKLAETDYAGFLEASMARESADLALIRNRRRLKVRAAMGRLPLKYREVLCLYYVDEMLYRDIADSLGIPIGTVMSRLTRARKGLKGELMQNKSTGPGLLLTKSPLPVV